MKLMEALKEIIQMAEALRSEDVEICPGCGNVYKIRWFKQGDHFNDFGMRYCPICGVLTDAHAHMCVG